MNIRTKMNPILKIIITFLFLTYQKSAFAYLDPGTGSAIIQAIIASVATGMYFLSTYFEKIKEFFVKIVTKRK